MKLLAIDPGETVGYAVLSLVPLGPGLPPSVLVLLRAWEEPVPSIKEFTPTFLRLLWSEQPDLVVIEDYRVHHRKAGMHVGRRLFTPELIGAIVALCSLTHWMPSCINTARIQPNVKGKWPNARIKVKFPEARGVAGHALDAVKLGLAYLEGEKLWTP